MNLTAYKRCSSYSNQRASVFEGKQMYIKFILSWVHLFIRLRIEITKERHTEKGFERVLSNQQTTKIYFFHIFLEYMTYLVGAKKNPSFLFWEIDTILSIFSIEFLSRKPDSVAHK